MKEKDRGFGSPTETHCRRRGPSMRMRQYLSKTFTYPNHQIHPRGRRIGVFQQSSCSKILEMPTKPPWSRGFKKFLLSKQLDVNKENEIWVLYADTPIRFSL